MTIAIIILSILDIAGIIAIWYCSVLDKIQQYNQALKDIDENIPVV